MIFRLCEISGRYPHGLSVQHDATDTFGFVSNTTKIQAHSPRDHEGRQSALGGRRAPGLLAPQLLVLVYLRVALIDGCPF